MSSIPDVLVIGGGIIGCAAAYELRKNGVNVTLMEQGGIGQESSGAAAGMLTPQAHADRDDTFFRLCLQARSLFPDYLEELRDLTGQVVEWHRDGLVDVAGSKAEALLLEQRYQWQQRAGLSVSLLAPEDLRQLEPHLRSSTEPALYFPDEAHLDNTHYTQVLAQAAISLGTVVCVQERVESLLVQGNRVRGVRSCRGETQAGCIVNAAGAWAAHLGPSGDTGLPVVPVRGQMLALKTDIACVGRLIFAQDCYLVPRKAGELLVGSTAEWVGYDKRTTADGIQRLLRGALDLAPDLKSSTFLRAWAGLRPGTPDSLPILGKDPVWEGLIHASGHFRNGILLSALTGKIITELITQNRTSVSLEEFAPARFLKQKDICSA